MRPRVSLCLIVKDEEAALAACLASAVDLFDEAVVVDTGSADRTREVAPDFNARVFPFAWSDSFAEARNESLRHATGEWVFWLDADESLDGANRDRLRALLHGLGAENAAYVMTQRSQVGGGGPALLVDQVRLFRNLPGHRWRYRVHEQIQLTSREGGASVRRADVVISHFGYLDPALQRRKLERNLRLLRLEQQEHADDPFVLLYLGWTCSALERPSEALPLLRRARDCAGAAFPLLPLVFAAEAGCLARLGRPGEGLAACAAGRERFPEDDALLAEEVALRRQQGDLAGAEACLRRLLAGPSERERGGPGPASFLPRPEGLRGYAGRHQLALLLREQGRLAEAEAEWRAVLAERPGFAPAAAQLGEVLLGQQRWPELEQAAAVLAGQGGAPVESALLRARARLARQELDEARRLLEEVLAGHPESVWPRVLLSQVFLRQGREAEAEWALREVLGRDPAQAESWCNLAKLLRNQGRLAEAAAVCAEGRRHFPDEPDLLRIQGMALHGLNDPAGAEACLVRFFEVQAGRAPPDPGGEGLIAEARDHLAQVLAERGRPVGGERLPGSTHPGSPGGGAARGPE